MLPAFPNTRTDFRVNKHTRRRFRVYRVIFLGGFCHLKKNAGGFPGGTVVKNPPASAGDMGSSPGLGRSHMPWSN